MCIRDREDAELAATLKKEIQAAYDDILAIPQPFRNNINSAEAKKAMETCATLEQTLSKSVKSFIEGLEGHEAEMQAIVDTFVDDVVLPTYNELEKRTATLLAEVNALAKNPTDAAFKEACAAWLDARQPWEESEAFLFGPVDALGLDPNMDSWPLDQTAIVNHINSGDFTDLNWGEGDSDDKVQAAQNIRGFHTLEFLLFENGQPRTMPK